MTKWFFKGNTTRTVNLINEFQIWEARKHNKKQTAQSNLKNLFRNFFNRKLFFSLILFGLSWWEPMATNWPHINDQPNTQNPQAATIAYLNRLWITKLFGLSGCLVGCLVGQLFCLLLMNLWHEIFDMLMTKKLHSICCCCIFLIDCENYYLRMLCRLSEPSTR